jgi:uncharacterized protein (TIGR02453 family)
MKEIYHFLQQLEANNNKDWFDKNRDEFKKAQQKISHLTELLINEVRSFDKEIGFLQPKDCMYRIYRDLRFSADKTPYKTNMGAYIAKNGKCGGYPGYYFHIQPNGSFVSGGLYMPNPAFLKAIRNEIYYHSDEFIDIIEEPEFKSRFSFFDEDKLKTNPKGFPADFEHIEFLRFKSIAPSVNVSEEQLFSNDIIDFIIENFRKFYPLNAFLYEAISKIE